MQHSLSAVSLRPGSPSYRPRRSRGGNRWIAGAVLFLVVACTSRQAYRTIDDATLTVQAAVTAYKRHCNVGPGEDGPGTCNVLEYTRAEATYAQFQQTALNAVDLAEKTGQTPLQVVTSAAASALELVEAWKR